MAENETTSRLSEILEDLIAIRRAGRDTDDGRAGTIGVDRTRPNPRS